MMGIFRRSKFVWGFSTSKRQLDAPHWAVMAWAGKSRRRGRPLPARRSNAASATQGGSLGCVAPSSARCASSWSRMSVVVGRSSGKQAVNRRFWVQGSIESSETGGQESGDANTGIAGSRRIGCLTYCGNLQRDRRSPAHGRVQRGPARSPIATLVKRVAGCHLG